MIKVNCPLILTKKKSLTPKFALFSWGNILHKNSPKMFWVLFFGFLGQNSTKVKVGTWSERICNALLALQVGVSNPFYGFLFSAYQNWLCCFSNIYSWNTDLPPRGLEGCLANRNHLFTQKQQLSLPVCSLDGIRCTRSTLFAID